MGTARCDWLRGSIVSVAMLLMAHFTRGFAFAQSRCLSSAALVASTGTGATSSNGVRGSNGGCRVQRGATRRFSGAASSDFASGFMRTLSGRGFIHQATDMKALDELMHQQKITAYLGFDATAPSLHVGSLVQIMLLRKLQQEGHKPVVLIGGATTKIGDPTGRDESRKLLDEATIQTNANSLKRVFEKFLTFGDGPSDAVFVDNNEWMQDMQYINFLRNYGRHFTINRMLTFESVKQRLQREQPLTFLEFNYMILQAYDFLELNRRLNCTLQLGGSDQWGNIVSGVELVRKVAKESVFGLTSPLITMSDGKKMGKSASGAVWLDRDMLPEFEYWQFWRNVADADVMRFLKLFTDVPLEEIEHWSHVEGAALNDAKRRLADEATTMLHGADCLEGIHKTADGLFGKSTSANLASLPVFDMAMEESGVFVFDILLHAKLVASKSEGKRLIRGGGASVNGVKVADEMQKVTSQELKEEPLQVSAGKKHHALIRFM